MMSDPEQFNARMDKQDGMLRDVLTALKGDQLGNPGIVQRLTIVENKIETKARADQMEALARQVDAHDRKLWLAGISLTAVWAAVLGFKDKLFH